MSRAGDAYDGPRARLREAADAHEPDRARILARVERGMAGTDEVRPPRSAVRPPLGWARVVGATAAVSSVLMVGGYAVASAVRDDVPARRTMAVSPTPDPSPDGPLRSQGSVDPHSNEFWAQSDVTLRAEKQLTALTVELRIRQTGGVSDAGSWRSLPESDFTTTVAERDGFLVYTWVLRAGHTVWPGEWVFAGQYDHDRGGRDAKDDGYAVTATTTDGRRATVAGDFARRDADGGS
jgi:hypothetical protein